MLGAAVALALALALPGVVIASDGSTNVTGNVEEGYTFTAPSAIALGDMKPGTTATGNSTDGRLDGNSATGYTVTGRDEKTPDAGFMVVSTNTLTHKLEISKEDASYDYADTGKIFLDTDDITGEDISLYVRQLVTYEDPVAEGYSITITFTVNGST